MLGGTYRIEVSVADKVVANREKPTHFAYDTNVIINVPDTGKFEERGIPDIDEGLRKKGLALLKKDFGKSSVIK